MRTAASATPSPTTTSLSEQAQAVLRANWREGVHRDGTPYAYTCPATPRYRHQWHWDSCFHAIAWCRHDVQRAREELRTVLRGGRADGFVPHTVFWHSHPRWRRAPLYATQRVRGSRHTTTIGPPLLPFAWERVAAASAGEPGFATESLHALEAHLDWLERERDVDGDGLITHPPARRVGPRRQPEVRPRLRALRALQARLLPARRALRPAGLERARRSRPSTTSTSRTCGSTSPTR